MTDVAMPKGIKSFTVLKMQEVDTFFVALLSKKQKLSNPTFLKFNGLQVTFSTLEVLLSPISHENES